MYFFTSSTSNISSVAMSRSDSCDSTASNCSTASTSSPPLDIRPRSSTASSYGSTISTTSSSQHHRTSSSCAFLPAPYKSCLQYLSVADEPSSYLSDDDLLALGQLEEVPTVDATPLRELTTEEQIEMMRQHADRALELGHQPYAGWQQPCEKKARMVRFAGEDAIKTSSRRSSSSRRKSMKKM